MTAPIEVGLLGYGKVARDLHRPAWSALAAQGRARVTMVCEPSADGARFAREHFPNAEVVRADAGEVLAEVRCDVIDICTPGHTHAALVLQGLARGLPTLVEKPLCHTAAEADAIIGAAKGTPISVGQTLRLSPPALAFQRARSAGHLGEVRRVRFVHHARHALSEAEWVTTARPDGILFENVVHAVDLCYFILGSHDLIRLDAVKFYETRHRRVLLGLEMLATDESGRDVSLDFLQDSLTHSSFQSNALVSATGADAELRFSPSGFRLMSGVVDPISELRADTGRLVDIGLGIVRPARRSSRHLLFFEDFLNGMHGDRSVAISPSAVRNTIATLEQLSRLWHAATPEAGTHSTVVAVPGTAGIIPGDGRSS